MINFKAVLLKKINFSQSVIRVETLQMLKEKSQKETDTIY